MDKKGWLLVAFLFFLPLVGAFEYTIIHENVHEQIFHKTGYQNISKGIGFDGFYLYAYTAAEPGPYADMDAQVKLNMITEIVGYHIQGLIINIWLAVMFFIMCLTLLLKRGGSDSNGLSNAEEIPETDTEKGVVYDKAEARELPDWDNGESRNRKKPPRNKAGS